MFEKLFFFLKGYVILKIQTIAKERFLNLCKAREIEIIDIIAIEDSIYCKIAVKDYVTIRPVVKKTGCLPKIERKCGMPFIIKNIKLRKGFLIGSIVGFLILTQFTGRIWYIDVKGGFLHTREQIVRMLKEELDIYGGVGRETIDCAEIERQIRLRYNDIGWVSVEKRGCNLYICLNESIMPEVVEKEDEPQHIIAERDGVVRKIEVLSGIAQVKNGDEVKKGDILISGIVPVMGDYDELIRDDPVGAEGRVCLETDFTYTAVYPMQYEEKIETERKAGFAIFLFGRKLFSYIPRYSEGKYDIITFDMVPFVFQDFEVPFSIRIYNIRAYETEPLKMTENEAKQNAEEAFERFLDDWEAQGVEILSRQFAAECSMQVCRALGSGVVQGNFISYQMIQEEEWKTEYEYSGDNP